MRVHVILPAAGIGTRMAAASTPHPAPKQFMTLGGLPLFVHTLRAFLAVPQVEALYLAVREQDIPRVQAEITTHLSSPEARKVHVVEGGDHRQATVARALATLTCAPDDIVLVHDAVRPLIDVPTIERTLEAILRHGAAIVGLPAVDTIKQVERTSGGAIITATIPRERVVLAQTPQGARFALLQQAFAEAAADEFTGTDEASLLERANIPVSVVPGSPRNFKITQPGDLELADFYLAQSRGPTPTPPPGTPK